MNPALGQRLLIAGLIFRLETQISRGLSVGSGGHGVDLGVLTVGFIRLSNDSFQRLLCQHSRLPICRTAVQKANGGSHL